MARKRLRLDSDVNISNQGNNVDYLKFRSCSPSRSPGRQDDSTTNLAQPGWYRVCLLAMVRAESSLESLRLRILPVGSKIHIVDVQGRRAKIDSPGDGWVSVASKQGETICVPIGPTTDPDHYAKDCAEKVIMDLIPVVCGKNDWPEGEELFKIIVSFLVDPKKETWNPNVTRLGGKIDGLFNNVFEEDFLSELKDIKEKEIGLVQQLEKEHHRKIKLRAELARLKLKLIRLKNSKTELAESTSVHLASLATQVTQMETLQRTKDIVRKTRRKL